METKASEIKSQQGSIATLDSSPRTQSKTAIVSDKALAVGSLRPHTGGYCFTAHSIINVVNWFYSFRNRYRSYVDAVRLN